MMTPSTHVKFLTPSQAEGAIEGSWEDYVMPTPFATDFKFSRYHLEADGGGAAAHRLQPRQLVRAALLSLWQPARSSNGTAAFRAMTSGCVSFARR